MISDYSRCIRHHPKGGIRSSDRGVCGKNLPEISQPEKVNQWFTFPYQQVWC
jgi:hypothetical protein